MCSITDFTFFSLGTFGWVIQGAGKSSLGEEIQDSNGLHLGKLTGNTYPPTNCVFYFAN